MRLPSTVAPARTTPHPSMRQRLASARAVSGVAIDERVTKSTTAAVTPDRKRGVGTGGLGDWGTTGLRIADSGLRTAAAPSGAAVKSFRNSWRVMRQSLMHRDLFRLELVERPAGVQELALDHRVALEGRHGIVEPLDLTAGRVPLGGGA